MIIEHICDIELFCSIWIRIGLVIGTVGFILDYLYLWIWIELIISNIRLVEPIGLQYFCLISEKEMEK